MKHEAGKADEGVRAPGTDLGEQMATERRGQEGGERTGRRVRLPALLVLVIGLLVTSVAFLGTLRLELRQAQSAFGETASRPATAVQRKLDLYVGDLQSIRRFYDASKSVERDEFALFVAGILTRRPAIEALVWAPRVPDAERAAFEATAAADHLPGLQITQRDGRGRAVRAPRRDGYYPAWYVEPKRDQKALFGLDLAIDRVAAGSLKKAGDSGGLQAFVGGSLVPSVSPNAILGIVVPVYRHDGSPEGGHVGRQQPLAGYILGLFRIGDLVGEAVGESRTEGVELRVYNHPDPRGEQPLVSYPSESSDATSHVWARLSLAPRHLRYVADLNVVSERWSIVCTPTAAYARLGRLWRAWWVLGLGFVLTVLFAAYISAMTGRAAWAEHLVGERTADLSQANEELQREIEQRERTEEALRDSEERFRSLVERMSEGLTVLNEQGRFTYVNPTMLGMLGYTAEEALGRAPAEFMDEANRAVLTDQLERRRRGETAAYEVAWTHRSGRHVHTIVSPRPLRSPDGQYRGSFAVITDITSRKLAEEQLERMSAELRRSNQELEQFAYVASHDLQEPLRKITAFGNRLESRAEGKLDEQAQDYLDRMQSAAQRMQGLINDLLAYSRVTTKGRPFVPVDLGEVVQGVLSDLEVRVQETGARVEVEPLPTIDADPSQMRQLFQNLIGNALKFRREGVAPAIRVSGEVTTERAAGGEPPQEFCRLVVEDNGIGFDQKHADRIFGVFQRLHARNEYEGTGIGLAICRRVVERHGGSIAAQSTPGEGARFTALLPVRREGGTANGVKSEE